ncbi:MAG: F0F1 ATP synthase subunit delta [Clostridia bacterium]
MADGMLLTPFHLTKSDKEAVEECFARMLGEPIELEERIDKSLLGGIRVTIDGCMYDGSLKARLGAVKRLLETGEGEEDAHA